MLQVLPLRCKIPPLKRAPLLIPQNLGLRRDLISVYNHLKGGWSMEGEQDRAGGGDGQPLQCGDAV